MSATAPQPTLGGTTTAGPWKKVAIGGAVAVALGGVFVIFSGRTNFFNHGVNKPKAVEVQMNGPINALVRPVEPVAAAPPPVRPAILARAPMPMANSDEQKRAIESNISAYAIKPVSSSGAAIKSASDQSPDEIPAGSQPDALEASLTPTKIDGTRVAELPNPRWLVEQGRVLPCTQQTKIDSTLAGMVTAIIPEAIRGETGDVALLPKGARVFGTVQHALMNGADRLAVLWQQITTPVLYDDRGMPHQFRVSINSPASSPLGETGLDGDVNHHYLKKIGGILGYSLIQGGIQYATQSAQQNQGGTSVNLNSFQNGGNSAAEELLKSWIAIPDVMTRNQGSQCAIFVARDLDMRGAYQLTQRYRSVQ